MSRRRPNNHWHCNRCNTDKPEGEFGIRNETGKPLSWCRQCHRDYERERRLGLERERETVRLSEMAKPDHTRIAVHIPSELYTRLSAAAGRRGMAKIVIDGIERELERAEVPASQA